ncbi:MarR family winged helix-turn-helix transcriptional regulator [Antarcticirhabdus aurantiaca]|uniref:MarR family winged helix-turn-helix transcriptional regulator n=1 Tax=Antarcticirhabdus aurantiaca TaxID=2606717 RepID=UPI00131ABA8A|nr:MarR family transcriptional regulator [Antarcticirhabdus aurantiaca]
MRKHVKAGSQDVPGGPDSVVAVLLSMSRSFRQLMQLKLAAIDVVVGQDSLLDLLRLEDTMTVTLVARTLNVRPSTISKMADIMVAQGWVVRESDDDDGRRTRLRLTPIGLERQAKVREIRTDLEAEVLAGLKTSNVQADVAATLDLVAAVLSGRLSRLR